MSRSNRAAKGFATSLLQTFAQIGVQVLLAPIVLAVVGKQALGAYAAIMQTVGLLSIVDIAGSWVLERFLGRATGVDDGGHQFRMIFTAARTIFLITNTLYAVGVIGISFFIAGLFHLSPGIAAQARYALYVVALWAIVKTPLMAYANALIAQQDLATVNTITAATSVMRGVASLSFVLMGGGLFGLIVSGSIVDCTVSFLYRWRFRRKYPHLLPGWGVPNRKLFREMLSFGGHAALINVGNALFFSTANIMAAVTNGAAEASVFYTSQMPAMTGYFLLQRLPGNAAPAVYELSGREETAKLSGAFVRLTRIMLFLTMPLGLGIILFNRDLVTCWVGTQQYAGMLLTSTLAIFCVLDSFRALTVLFAFTQGWTRLLTGTALFQGVANVGLAYAFGKDFGIGGITLALSIVIFPQMIILGRKIGNVFQISWIPMVAGALLRVLLPLAAAGVTGWVVHARVHISYHHFRGLIFECAAFLVVYLLIGYPLGLHEQERNDIRQWVGAAFRSGARK